MREQDLILRCQNNDLGAFDELVMIYEKKIFNMCLYMVKNREDAADVTQEVFIKIYRSINRFEGKSSFSTWLYRVTYNSCLDYLKRKKDTVPFDEMIGQGIKINKIEGIIEGIETREIIKKCIMALKEEYRTIILLRDINGLSYQEIAQIICIEEGTVKSRLFRAREALREMLIRNGF